MRELAIVEGHIYQSLKATAAAYGWPKVQRVPFDVQDGPDGLANIAVPLFYFRNATARDVRSVGPGPRVGSSLDYEVGIFHRGNSLGHALPIASGTVLLLTALQVIDDLFQNYPPPVFAGLGGYVSSIERLLPVTVPEVSNGTRYRRDGGIYRFVVQVT